MKKERKMKNLYFVRKNNLEKPVYTIRFVLPVFSCACVTRYLQRINETPIPITICIVVVDLVLRVDVLDLRVCILM